MTRIDLMDWAQAAPIALPLRIEVFVREQGVPADIEHDEWDQHSRHAIAVAEDGRVLGTGRLLPDGHVGRMAVARDVRNQGIGSALLLALMQEADRLGHTQLKLNAQLTAVAFYARHGFKVGGPDFLEAGIAHVPMHCDLPQAVSGQTGQRMR